MSICPITYEACEGKYSLRGLKKLSRSLMDLQNLPYTASDQILEAATRAPKMSIQGVQPKLSAVLNTRKSRFEIVDTGGRYIVPLQTKLEFSSTCVSLGQRRKTRDQETKQIHA